VQQDIGVVVLLDGMLDVAELTGRRLRQRRVAPSAGGHS